MTMRGSALLNKQANRESMQRTRALFEERLLSKDERYQAYCGRVGWHLVPGLF